MTRYERRQLGQLGQLGQLAQQAEIARMQRNTSGANVARKVGRLTPTDPNSRLTRRDKVEIAAAADRSGRVFAPTTNKGGRPYSPIDAVKAARSTRETAPRRHYGECCLLIEHITNVTIKEG